MTEPAFDEMPELVDGLAGAFAQYLDDGPYALFGHSLGARVAFEFAREIRRRSLPGPAHLIVSAHRPPHRAEPRPPVHTAPREEVLARLREYGGMPSQALAEPALIDLMLPTLRSDFALFERSAWIPEHPLSCPLTALGGTSDAMVPASELPAWADLTAGRFQMVLVPGGHFFITSAPRATIAIVRQALTTTVNRMEGRRG